VPFCSLPACLLNLSLVGLRGWRLQHEYARLGDAGGAVWRGAPFFCAALAWRR